jgi:hypothetical protein
VFEKLEKDSVRDLAAAQKNGAAIRAKSEKRVASYTKEAHATLASEQAKEAKRFKKELAERCVNFVSLIRVLGFAFCVSGFVWPYTHGHTKCETNCGAIGDAHDCTNCDAHSSPHSNTDGNEGAFFLPHFRVF